MSALSMLVTRPWSEWQGSQKCVVPKQNHTATLQQKRHLNSVCAATHLELVSLSLSHDLALSSLVRTKIFSSVLAAHLCHFDA